MSKFNYAIKVPKERIGVLIGKNGEIKKKIEEETHIQIDVDSKEGEVRVSGEDALALFTSKNIIKAIARGYNPDIALTLLKQDYILELLEVSNYTKPSQIDRVKGRVIGKDGKTRQLIEELTETYISVYGKTIGIIGEVNNVTICKRAVESLLSGSTHAAVYKWLEKRRRKLKQESMEKFVEKNIINDI